MEPEVIRLIDAAARAVGILQGVASDCEFQGRYHAAEYLKEEAQKLEEALNDVTRRM